MKQYHKRFYLYGKTVPELLDKINEFTKQYNVGNIFDVSIMEVLDKQIEIQKIIITVKLIIILIILIID